MVYETNLSDAFNKQNYIMNSYRLLILKQIWDFLLCWSRFPLWLLCLN